MGCDWHETAEATVQPIKVAAPRPKDAAGVAEAVRYQPGLLRAAPHPPEELTFQARLPGVSGRVPARNVFKIAIKVSLRITCDTEFPFEKTAVPRALLCSCCRILHHLLRLRSTFWHKIAARESTKLRAPLLFFFEHLV